MNFYPAIDLKEGQCVRLLRGELDTAIVYNDDPVAQAKIFQEAGCHWLHVVDLDGAVSGSTKNVKTIEEIISSTSLKIQVGGGIRTLKQIEFWKDICELLDKAINPNTPLCRLCLYFWCFCLRYGPELKGDVHPIQCLINVLKSRQ